MALNVRLKPAERVLVNGATIINSGPHAASLRIGDQAVVIRERAIMRAEQADTPAKRLYFAAQLAYVDASAAREEHRRSFSACFEALADACRTPEALQLLAKCGLGAARNDWWPAMQAARALIAYEAELLQAA